MTDNLRGVFIWYEQDEPPRVLIETAVGTACIAVFRVGEGFYADTIAAGPLTPFFNMATGRNLLYKICERSERCAGEYKVPKEIYEDLAEWTALRIYVNGKIKKERNPIE